MNGQFFYFYFINIIIQQTVEFRRIELVFTKLWNELYVTKYKQNLKLIFEFALLGLTAHLGLKLYLQNNHTFFHLDNECTPWAL